MHNKIILYPFSTASGVTEMRSFTKEFAVMLAILLLLPSTACSQRLLVYPCIDFEIVRWVRDQNSCDQYYICHFGQPLAMPSCPPGQVWSNSALNCVPEKSRWDDCNVKASTSSWIKTLISRTPFPYPTSSTDINYRFLSATNATDKNVIISTEQLPILQSQIKSAVHRVLSKDVINLPNAQDQFSHRDLNFPARPTENWQMKESVTRSTWRQNMQITTARPLVTNSRKGQVIWTPAPWYTKTYPKGSHEVHQQNVIARPRSWNATLHQHKIEQDHQCLLQPGSLFPHPEKCHWYINCSLNNIFDDISQPVSENAEDTFDDSQEGFILLEPFRVRQAGLFVWECRYPQLFDHVTGRCREFINVNCHSRYEAVDQCEYSARQCITSRCVPCERRFGRCRGRENGVYPLHSDRWTPVFITCYQQRNIAQDECTPPTPIFSPDRLDCVSLFDVPKEHGGFLPDCTTRSDGYYPDEQGRCAIFFRCALGQFRGYDECPPGSVFDPIIPACQPYSFAPRPCGEGQAPLCGGKQDGFYADPYGRCTHYFQCKQGVFQQYLTCDLGIFDPLTQKCVLAAELTVRPCGLQPSPCEALPTGVYPDQATGCQHFIECHQGNMIVNGTCQRGTVFSAITGRCDIPELAPPPCGVSDACIGRPDGRYPALSRGCSFFYECYHGEFVSLRRCTTADGGFFFNPETGTCDYPQNICPPCGYRWWGCPRTYQL